MASESVSLAAQPLALERNMMPYKTSRGCWWGQKHHCTFCGINGGGMGFRDKSPDLALDQVRKLRQSAVRCSRCNHAEVLPQDPLAEAD